MGIYLTKPSTDVNYEDGKDYGLEFGVGEMQGWRKNMEDAHIAELALPSNDNIALFAVFDGHGGMFLSFLPFYPF